MPGGDKTGPMGMGPMTGRGMGCCAGYMAPATGRGFGRGRGLNRCYHAGMHGRMRSADATAYEHNEKELLTDRVAFLEEQLQRTRAQLKSMDEGQEPV